MGNEGQRWAARDELVPGRVSCGGVSDRRETALLTFGHCREVEERKREEEQNRGASAWVYSSLTISFFGVRARHSFIIGRMT